MAHQLDHLSDDELVQTIDFLLCRQLDLTDVMLCIHDWNSIPVPQPAIDEIDYESLFPSVTQEEFESFLPEIFPDSTETETETETATADDLVGPSSNLDRSLEEIIILQHLKLRTCYQDEVLDEICVVCQNEYEVEEILATLDCGHEYHGHCISRWLLEKNICPVCKQIAIQQLDGCFVHN